MQREVELWAFKHLYNAQMGPIWTLLSEHCNMGTLDQERGFCRALEICARISCLTATYTMFSLVNYASSLFHACIERHVSHAQFLNNSRSYGRPIISLNSGTNVESHVMAIPEDPALQRTGCLHKLTSIWWCHCQACLRLLAIIW